MPATATLTTFEEFRRLPESEAYILELRNGDVVQVTRPKKRHGERVYRIRRSLQPIADQTGYLKEEFSFRPLPEYELRVADLAYVPWERWNRVPDDDYLPGAPDFVVEVASPSNTRTSCRRRSNFASTMAARNFGLSIRDSGKWMFPRGKERRLIARARRSL